MPDNKEPETTKPAANVAATDATAPSAASAAKAEKPKAPRQKKVAQLKASRPKKAAPIAAAPVAAASVSGSTRKTYSPKERAQKLDEIQKLIKGGDSVKNAAKKIGVSEQTYYQWKKPAAKKADSGGGSDLTDLVKLEQENARLKKLLAERLRQENTDLKKKLGIS